MHRAAAWLLLLAALACAAHGFEAVRPKREDADAGAAKAARRSERGPDEIEQGNVAADATRGARGPPSAAAADTEGVFVYTVEHAIGSAPFSLRGKVTLEFGPLAKVGTAKFSEAKFSPAELDSLMAAAADPNALYRLRFVPESPAPSPAQQPVQTFTRACALVASELREMLTFHADIYGHLLAVSYRTPVEGSPQSKGRLSFGAPGEPPLEQFNTLAAQRAKEAAKEEPGFLQKYWKYLIPMAILVVVNGLFSPQGGSGGGGGS